MDGQRKYLTPFLLTAQSIHIQQFMHVSRNVVDNKHAKHAKQNRNRLSDKYELHWSSKLQNLISSLEKNLNDHDFLDATYDKSTKSINILFPKRTKFLFNL